MNVSVGGKGRGREGEQGCEERGKGEGGWEGGRVNACVEKEVKEREVGGGGVRMR